MSEVSKLNKDDLQRALKSLISTELESQQPDVALKEKLDALSLVPTHMREIKEELTELRKGIEYVMKQTEQLTKDNNVKMGLIQDQVLKRKLRNLLKI